MKKNKLLIFSAITVIVILAASIISKLQAPQVKREKEILLPELESRINDVAAITIKGSKRIVDLQKLDDTWIIKNADNYPAVFEKVRDTVISLSTFKIIAEKTDNPEFYSRLDVEGPEFANSRSLLLTLKDTSGQIITSIILGAPRHSKAASNKPGLYVRRPNEKQALLVEGALFITDQVTDWFNQNILDIPSSVIREVWIRHPDGEELKMSKEVRGAPEFKLQGDVKQVKSVFKLILTRISTSLEELRADDVISINNFEFPDDTVVTTFKTFDGLIITVKSATVDDKPYSNFSFNVDGSLLQDAADSEQQTAENINIENEARILNSVLSDWVYQIPDFKYQDLTKKLENITTSLVPGSENSIKQPVNTLDKLNFPQ